MRLRHRRAPVADCALNAVLTATVVVVATLVLLDEASPALAARDRNGGRQGDSLAAWLGTVGSMASGAFADMGSYLMNTMPAFSDVYSSIPSWEQLSGMLPNLPSPSHLFQQLPTQVQSNLMSMVNNKNPLNVEKFKRKQYHKGSMLMLGLTGFYSGFQKSYKAHRKGLEAYIHPHERKRKYHELHRVCYYKLPPITKKNGWASDDSEKKPNENLLPEGIKEGLCTHLIITSNVKVSHQKWTVSMAMDELDDGRLIGIVGALKKACPNVLLQIPITGAYNHGGPHSLKSPLRLIRSSMSLVRRYGLAGLDFDLAWHPSALPLAAELLEAYRQYMLPWPKTSDDKDEKKKPPEPLKKILLSVTVPTFPAFAHPSAVRSLAVHADWVHIQPLAVSLSHQPYPLSALGKNVLQQSVLEWTRRGLLYDKVVLGVPLFGVLLPQNHPPYNHINTQSVDRRVLDNLSENRAVVFSEHSGLPLVNHSNTGHEFGRREGWMLPQSFGVDYWRTNERVPNIAHSSKSFDWNRIAVNPVSAASYAEPEAIYHDLYPVETSINSDIFSKPALSQRSDLQKTWHVPEASGTQESLYFNAVKDHENLNLYPQRQVQPLSPTSSAGFEIGTGSPLNIRASRNAPPDAFVMPYAEVVSSGHTFSKLKLPANVRHPRSLKDIAESSSLVQDGEHAAMRVSIPAESRNIPVAVSVPSISGGVLKHTKLDRSSNDLYVPAVSSTKSTSSEKISDDSRLATNLAYSAFTAGESVPTGFALAAGHKESMTHPSPPVPSTGLMTPVYGGFAPLGDGGNAWGLPSQVVAPTGPLGEHGNQQQQEQQDAGNAAIENGGSTVEKWLEQYNNQMKEQVLEDSKGVHLGDMSQPVEIPMVEHDKEHHIALLLRDVADRGVVSYGKICAMIAVGALKVRRGPYPFAWVGTDVSGDSVVFQDQRSLTVVARWAEDSGLAGLALLSLNDDDWKGKCDKNGTPFPLARAVWRTIG